jgi:hypothetical protein
MNAVTFLTKQGNRGSDDIDLKTLCKFDTGSTRTVQRTDRTLQAVRKFVVIHLVKKFPDVEPEGSSVRRVNDFALS